MTALLVNFVTVLIVSKIISAVMVKLSALIGSETQIILLWELSSR